MRQAILTAFLLLSGLLSFADDLMLLRDGREVKGKLDVISEKSITFHPKAGTYQTSKEPQDSYPTNEVYMIKTKKRGTIFFDRRGERKVTSTKYPPKKACIIYLVDGEEIEAWDLQMANGIIQFKKSASEATTVSNVGMYPKEEIFLIKYPDGSKDLFTDISLSSMPGNNNGMQNSANDSGAKIKVVMHKVVSGETLGSIAKKYNVTVAKIVEWNELSAKSTGTTRPAVGSQIMIQQTLTP